jgi:hypothetical protein
MQSRVDTISLHLRVPDAQPDEIASTRRMVETRILQDALDEVERVVHDRLGRDAIVRVRRLSVKWKLDDDAFHDPDIAKQLGRDLAQSVLAEIDLLPPAQHLRPIATRNVVVFESVTHAIAVMLADRAAGIEAWFHTPTELRDAAPALLWATVAARPEQRVDVERWLERMEVRAHVLAWLAAPHEIAASPLLDRESIGTQPDAIVVVERATASPIAIEVARDRDATIDIPAIPTRALEQVTTDVEPTNFAGVWYLARLVQDLELAEALWAVGVAEGDVLARIALAILGDDARDDAAWRWFGGAIAREPEPFELPAWALDEVAAKLASNLTRLSAPQLVEPGRDVVAIAASALCHLFCTRAGYPTSIDRMRTQLAVRGRMLASDDEVRVFMPIEAIDIDLRRAALDLDPGYLPWLERTVKLEFESPLGAD